MDRDEVWSRLMRWCLFALTLVLAAGCTPDAVPPGAQPSSAPAPSATPATGHDDAFPRLAVTVDDLPIHGPDVQGMDRAAIAERLIAAFAAHHLPPVHGFVNGRKVEEHPGTEAILHRWIESGHRLGNHTWSHPSLNKMPLADYFADIEKGEAILRKLVPDANWKVFRYPFLHEGDTPEKRDGARKYLFEKGYRIAEVTIDADDWAYNPPYARCAARGDQAELEQLTRSFVQGHVEELHRVRELTHTLVGRHVPHILLLHIGAADAAAIEALLTAYEAEHVRFIDLDTALADPFYAMDPARPHPFGAAFPYLLAKARGVTSPPPVFARDLEERLDRTCR